MKILHSADWHLGSPLVGRSPEQADMLSKALLNLPHQIVEAARANGCDMMLLSGDLFDGAASPESIAGVKAALAEAAMPVFIAPGNHDHLSPSSPWLTERWPGNVHIFTSAAIESVGLSRLDCRVFGAAFTGPESDALLKDFQAACRERWAIGIFHGDPTQARSPYNPVTADQVAHSRLDYLALGHIHKGSSFREGSTLCAWPGCPMGRGFDELGPKGVLIVTLEGSAQAEFLPLDTPSFFDLETEALSDPAAALNALLPAAGNEDFYRVTLTGECTGLDIENLTRQFSRFPNLELRDRTVQPVDLWAVAGDDSLEGVYFGLLQKAMENADETAQRRIQMAAKVSRQILDGMEVKLP